MHKTFVTFFALLLLCSAAFCVDDSEGKFDIPAGKLTLDEACKMVIENNPGIREVVQRLESAKATVQQARSTLYPAISLTSSYTTFDMTMQPDWEPTVRMDADFQEFKAGLNARWTVFDGFTRRATILAAEENVLGVTWQIKEAHRLLLEAVTTTFYQAQLAREQMTIAAQNWEFNKELQDNATKRWNVGDAPESDALTFSVNAIQAEVQYRSAFRDFQLITTVLAQLLALPDSRLPESLLPATDHHLPATTVVSYETEIEYAKRHRPDLQALDSAIRALELQLKATKGAYWPRLDAIGGFQYTHTRDNDFVDQDENNAFVGITASFDLFSGFRRDGQVKEVTAILRAQNYARENLVNQISADIQSRILELDAARDIYERQLIAFEQTVKIRDFVEKAYLAGDAGITRLNEAQTNLVSISGLLASSKLMIRLSRANLQIASGGILANIEKK